MFLLDNYYRELAVNGRRIKSVKSIKEISDFITINQKHDLYTTVYSYERLNGHNLCNYTTSKVDKVFMDFDVHSNEEGESVLSEVKNFVNSLTDLGFYNSVNFSGRGFHVFVYTKINNLKTPKQAIRSFVLDISERYNLHPDMSVVGDIARLVRLIGTTNTRSGLYCIPLKKDELTSYKDIKELANQRRNIDRSFLNGTKLLNLKEYDGFNVSNEEISDLNVDLLKEPMDINFFKSNIEDIPCISEVADDDSAGWEKRTLLLGYLKSQGYSVIDARHILKTILSEEKYKKSNCARTHAEKYYNSSYSMPSCKRIAEKGLCPLYEMGKSQIECKYYMKLNI